MRLGEREQQTRYAQFSCVASTEKHRQCDRGLLQSLDNVELALDRPVREATRHLLYRRREFFRVVEAGSGE